jgi:precorrin-6B methylase 2
MSKPVQIHIRTLDAMFYSNERMRLQVIINPSNELLRETRQIVAEMIAEEAKQEIIKHLTKDR